jgi:predicted metal-dependent enzyme (double-stranded beta helix superfamily)
MMTAAAYTLSEFVTDLRGIAADTKEHEQIITRVIPLAKRMAVSEDWLDKRYYACDPEQGFGVHLLHEEPDHTLAVFAVARLPHRATPPHNHGTWAVVVGVDGPEKYTFWKRLDDGSRVGYAEITQIGARVISPSGVARFLPPQIHSVDNETNEVTLSLHVYGKHINFTGRSQFDPETNTETPFSVKQEPH